jgi:putative flippase GtrA
MKKLLKLKDVITYYNANGIYLIPKNFIGYTIAGVVSVSVLLFVQLVLIEYFKIPFIYSQILASLAALITSFSINLIFTFKDYPVNKSKKIIQYIFFNLLTLFLNVNIASILFDLFGIWYIASIIGAASSIVINFISYKYIIWRVT